MIDEATLKEQYEYWRLFLLESKNFRAICDAIRPVRKDVGWPEALYDWCTCDAETSSLYFEWIGDNSSLIEYPEWLGEEDNFRQGPLLLSIYPLFQDIFEEDFDSVWHRIQLYYNKAQHPEAVFDGTLAVMNLFEAIERSVAATLGKSPTVEEFKDHFFTALVHEDRSRKLFSVANFQQAKNLTIKQFRNALNEIHDRSTIDTPKRFLTYPWAIYEPTGKIDPNKYDIYLKAFKIDQQYESPAECLKAFDPSIDVENDPDIDTHTRTFRRHCSKAVKLINNAERANFPGKIG